MKRKYKHVQAIMDETLLGAITEGESRNPVLKQLLRQTLVEHLTMTGEITVAYLLDVLCGTELIAAKQRLRSAGHVEITKGNEVKAADQLTPHDAEFIDQRRAAHIAGELKTRVEFNHRYGRVDAAAEASRQLALFGSADDVPVEEPDDATVSA